MKLIRELREENARLQALLVSAMVNPQLCLAVINSLSMLCSLKSIL